MNKEQNATLRFALPKGRMQKGVFELLNEAGIDIKSSSRGYRPVVSIADVESKILKPRNIVEMLQLGSRDLGFAGADWVSELADGCERQPIEILDTRLDPVKLVVAVPGELLVDGCLPKERHLRIASEYGALTNSWISKTQLNASLVRSNGATEVFPPEDADLIIDNTATGATLHENGLVIIDEIMASSTRLYASQDAFNDPSKRSRIEDLKLLLQAVLDGRRRSMIEVNVSTENLEQIISVLPAMKQPTVAPLFGDSGFAVRAAVLRSDLADVIPKIKSAGGRDVVVSDVNQIIP